MDKETAIRNIKKLEDKYGIMIFRMGLTALVDLGRNNLSDGRKADSFISGIMKQNDVSEYTDNTPIISAECQCEILRCATALTDFSIWDVFAYIQKYVHIE